MRMAPATSRDGWRRSITSKPSRSEGGCGEAGQVEGFGAGQGDSAAGPDGGMNGERKPLAAAGPGQAGEAAGVIEMAVTQHDALEVSEVDTEAFGVDRHSLRGHAGVEQQRRAGRGPADGDQGRETVLGLQADRGAAAIENRRRRPGRCPGADG